MAKKWSNRPSAAANDTLAQLRWLYGQKQLRTTAFGRRVALPSEIADHLRTTNLTPTTARPITIKRLK